MGDPLPVYFRQYGSFPKIASYRRCLDVSPLSWLSYLCHFTLVCSFRLLHTNAWFHWQYVFCLGLWLPGAHPRLCSPNSSPMAGLAPEWPVLPLWTGLSTWAVPTRKYIWQKSWRMLLLCFLGPWWSPQYWTTRHLLSSLVRFPTLILTLLLITDFVLLAVTLMFCLGDIDSILATPTGQPYIGILLNATHSVPAAKVLTVIILILLVSCAVNLVTTSSRQLW